MTHHRLAHLEVFFPFFKGSDAPIRDAPLDAGDTIAAWYEYVLDSDGMETVRVPLLCRTFRGQSARREALDAIGEFAARSLGRTFVRAHSAISVAWQGERRASIGIPT
jgi:hypothetical protein